MRDIVLCAVALRLEKVVLPAVPAAGPGLVCPAEGEGEVGLSRGEHLVEGPVEEALPVEPVVVVAEAVDARITRKLRLPLSRFRKPQVIEAEVRRDVWLIVAREQRLGRARRCAIP